MNDKTVEIICWACGGLIALWILMTVLPYLVLFLALCGAWHLYQEFQRDNRRNRR